MLLRNRDNCVKLDQSGFKMYIRAQFQLNLVDTANVLYLQEYIHICVTSSIKLSHNPTHDISTCMYGLPNT